MAHKFVDHLAEYMKELTKRYIEDRSPEELPQEFIEVAVDRLVLLIADGATPILRKMEDDAIRAAIEGTAALIRHSKKTKSGEHEKA